MGYESMPEWTQTGDPSTGMSSDRLTCPSVFLLNISFASFMPCTWQSGTDTNACVTKRTIHIAYLLDTNRASLFKPYKPGVLAVLYSFKIQSYTAVADSKTVLSKTAIIVHIAVYLVLQF